MTKQEEIRTSKFLSLVLRHKPEVIKIVLDKNGWVDIKTLLESLKKVNIELSKEDLQFIVDNNEKKRFAISSDGKKIRASQGHSVDVDLQLKETIPPKVLYHGTIQLHINSIKKSGLVKGDRHHVHLSKDKETAVIVGTRYGTPIIMEIDSMRMYYDGIKFYISDNGVYLVDMVPYEYIKIL